MAMHLMLLLVLGQSDVGESGRRIDLGAAVLFVPAGYRADGGAVDVLLHLHGASSVLEPAVAAIGAPWVLIAFQRSGLSSVYARPFADPKLFPTLLERAMVALDTAGIVAGARPRRVAVSAFSAGFGGVRELLKVPEHAARIDTIILADALYCGYSGAPADRRLDPALMAGFRAFARAAASGRKTLLVTHSAQVPDGYASTTETADDLIGAVGGAAEPLRQEWGAGWVQARVYRRGGFQVLGFEGAGPEDHMRHLRRIGELWKLALAGPGVLGEPPEPLQARLTTTRLPRTSMTSTG